MPASFEADRVKRSKLSKVREQIKALPEARALREAAVKWVHSNDEHGAFETSERWEAWFAANIDQPLLDAAVAFADAVKQKVRT